MEDFVPDRELACANDFIKAARQDGISLPKTKIQKLMYFFYGHFLAKYGTVLFSEKFQAWQYGPVLPRVFNRTNGSNSVTSYLRDADGRCYSTSRNSEYAEDYFSVFDFVWKKYGKLTASNLTALSHAPGSPWAVTIDTIGQCKEIEPELIKKYFLGESLING